MAKLKSIRFDYEKLEQLIAARGSNLLQAFSEHPNGRTAYYNCRRDTDLPLRDPIVYLIRKLNLTREEFCSLWTERS